MGVFSCGRVRVTFCALESTRTRSFWFVTPTLLVMIAHYLDPWVRRISVEAVDHVLTFLAYGLLPFMGRPSTVPGTSP